MLFLSQFFPKNEKYVSLFSGGDEQDIVDKRSKLREQIKASIVAAAASGKDLEGTLLFRSVVHISFDWLCIEFLLF